MSRVRKLAKGTTQYSLEIEGMKENYYSSVRFDITDGVVGIDQWNRATAERVLLSPVQMQELVAFWNRYK